MSDRYKILLLIYTATIQGPLSLLDFTIPCAMIWNCIVKANQKNTWAFPVTSVGL